ncbi:saccharopine dehydrogenase family protein [Nocardia stercoris]|uniref:Saccharopine dehydrogenase n=1 Tax=Nocardia stercoris TaxID=2483361 RepID=A0A3M2KXB8_9NOCA|nr:saccharopine dehydrogenase NADP-binding domain-containing protein [Nocardia stercoris]RMI30159.1 saccharopine dehydrogenase [Nocardia stercoris]
MTAQKVVFIGAAGEMCRLAVQRFAKAPGDWHLTLADIRPNVLHKLVRTLPPGRASVEQVDLYDEQGLLELVTGASLVVLGAGPYMRTSSPVVEACLAARVPYLDFDDDVESTEHALSLHERARAAGIAMYIGCGASPGMSNVLAVDAAAELDEIERIDMYWAVGDERPNVGRAVLEHMLHISAGDCHTWEGGRRVIHESYVETGLAPMGGPLGDITLYETAHPESVTMPRRFPQADRIRVIGGLDPAPFNGIIRGLATAVHKRELTVEEAIDYIMALFDNKIGNVGGLKASARGLYGLLRKEQSNVGEIAKFLGRSAVGRTYTWRGGLAARVYGVKDGLPHTAIRRTPDSGPHTYLMRNMATITGTACAAFMVMALDQAGQRAGAFAPEDWAEPKAFYDALVAVGTPRHEIVERV